VDLHSALDDSRRDGHTTRVVLFIDMLVDKAVRNDLNLKTRVVHSVVPTNNLMNDTIRKEKLPEYGSFPVILSPYSNRGERIGAHISVYEEREREIIKYTCFINKEKRKRGPVVILDLFFPKESLRPEQGVLSPADVLNY
jgi:hypothetical protein